MSLKRPYSHSQSNSSSESLPEKRLRSSSSVSVEDAQKLIKIYILQAKLDSSSVSELYTLVDDHNKRINQIDEAKPGCLRVELCGDVSQADLIVTAISMRRRLERNIDWKLARQKAIVTPDWLRDSIAQNTALPCGKYAALSELREETVHHCPDKDCQRCRESGATNETQRPYLPTEEVRNTSSKVMQNYSGRYACTRACPLECPNQTLVNELNILCLNRELEGLKVNTLSYARAIAMIKSYPKPITRELFDKEVVKLPHIGDKIASKVEEYLKNGYIVESKTIRSSERFQALSAFSEIYGVGPATARTLYDIGLRTIEDMERYYDVPVGGEEELVTPNGRKIVAKNVPPNLPISMALALRKDLDVKIPRKEVEEMHRIVMSELDEVQPGCISTIVGGYRRGKPESNDVDIVISHLDIKNGAKRIKDLSTRFSKHLYQKGLVVHVMHLSGFHVPDALRTEHWDSLEKALTVFVLPPDESRPRIHRRLDLIFAPPEAYWTAVVGWTGSKMFERDLRLWAKQEKGLKFDSSGLTRRHDSKAFIPRSEKEVFDILGLEWIDPTLRNADA